MSLDSLNAHALLLELAPLLVDSRVQKFSQISEQDFLLHLRSPGRTDKLLISLHPERSRLHLLPDAHPPAIVPSAFLMLCRKHFGGCRLLRVEQKGLERAIEFHFSSEYRLVFDWSGRPSQLLLLAPETALVAGAFPNRGRFPTRQPYPEPEPSELPWVTELTGEQALERFEQAQRNGLTESEALGAIVRGLPPLWSKRLRAQSGASFAPLWDAIMAPLRDDDRSALHPGLASDGELTYLEGAPRPYPSLSLAASARWAESTRAPGVPDHRDELLRTLRKGRDKSLRKMEKREKDKKGAESAPRDQLYGDLLLAYASSIGGRAPEFRTQDWEGRPLTIPLEPSMTATENAERYYLRAKKKKRALAVLDEQIGLAAEEIAFWDELLYAAESAENRTDLEEVRKAIPGSRQGKKRRAPEVPSSGPRRFEHDGFQLLVGRNPAQNEKLSLRDAARDDQWFHVRLGAGSHVLLRTGGREVREATQLAAAWLAAVYSKSSAESRCAVITTPVRFLKKPKGGPLGKVTYRSEREIVVDPTSAPPEGLRRLDKKEIAP